MLSLVCGHIYTYLVATEDSVKDRELEMWEGEVWEQEQKAPHHHVFSCKKYSLFYQNLEISSFADSTV